MQDVINFKPDPLSSKSVVSQIEDLRDKLVNCESRTGAAIGGAYTLGDTEIPAVTPGVFALLEMIDSPFVATGDGKIQFTRLDVVKALYVIANGPRCLRPIMAISQRIAQLKKLEDLAKTNADMFDRYLARVDKITEEYANFEEAANEWFAKIDAPDWLEIEELITTIFEDLYSYAAEVEDVPGKKKRSATRNGDSTDGSAT